MKKLYKSILTIFITYGIFSVTLFSCNDGKINPKSFDDYSLLKRKSSLSYTTEWDATQKNAATFKQKISKNPNDIRSTIGLVSLYINEARITGNYDYYNAAALSGIEKVLALKPDNFEALTFKATLLLSEHQFAPALEVAEKIKVKFPYNAYVYGIITDAQVELGNYSAAIEAADRMISLRPDNRSYSRIAYLREIHGDIPGAIEAMKLAVDAGAAGDENTEWSRIQLGKLYEQSGDKSGAKSAYETALENRNSFPAALNGLARLAFEEKKYPEALKYYQQADAIISDHASMEGIAAVYESTGEQEKAKKIRNEIFVRMKAYAGDGNTSKPTGQNEDHEMAHACMGVDDLELALKYAITEYNRRPGNIEVNETVAAVFARQGEYGQALPFIENALRTQSKKIELLALAREVIRKQAEQQQQHQ